MKKNDLFKVANIIEDRSVKMLKFLNIDARRNNLDDKKDVDLILNVAGIDYTADVQFSQNFEKYKDVRFDLISMAKSEFSISEIENHLKKSTTGLLFDELKQIMNIIKVGKIYHKKRPDFLIYWFFNNEMLRPETQQPDYILILNTESLVNYLNDYWRYHLNEFKINKKKRNGLEDDFISAFMAMPLDRLISYDRIKSTLLNGNGEKINPVDFQFKKEFSKF